VANTRDKDFVFDSKRLSWIRAHEAVRGRTSDRRRLLARRLRESPPVRRGDEWGGGSRLAAFPISVPNCGLPGPSVPVLRRRTSGRHTAGTQLRHADTHPAAGAAVGRAGAQLQPFDESRPADDRVRRRPGRPHAVLDDRLSVTVDGPVRDHTRVARESNPTGEPRPLNTRFPATLQHGSRSV